MRQNATKWLLAVGFILNASAPAFAVETTPGPGRSTPVASTPAAVEKIDLQFRPLVGEERVLRLHVVQSGTQVGAKTKSAMRQVIGMDTAYRVLSVATDGRVRLQSTTRATRFLREVDGKVLSRYDSAKPTKADSAAADTLALMVGVSYIVRLNSDGTIDDVEDKDKVVEQMLDKMKIPEEERELLRPLMLGALQGSAFKNLGNIFASFRDGEVAIGDSWPKTDVVTDDSNLIYDGALTLAKRSGGRSTLHLKSIIKPDPKRDAKATVLPMSGTQTGYYLVDEKIGWTHRAHLEQRWSAFVDESGVPIKTKLNNARRLYVKMTFDVGTLSAK